MTKTNQKNSTDCLLSFDCSHELAHKILADAELKKIDLDQWFIDTLERHLKTQKEQQ